MAYINAICSFIKEHYKIYLPFFLIVTLPAMIILTIYLYSSTNEYRQQEILENFYEFQKGAAALENEFSDITNFSSQLSETKWLNDLLYAKHENKDISIEGYDLHVYNNEFKSYTALNSFIKLALIYFPQREYILSSESLLYSSSSNFKLTTDEGKDMDLFGILSERNIGRFIPNINLSYFRQKQKGLLWVTSYPYNNDNIRANLMLFIPDANIRNALSGSLDIPGCEINYFRDGKLVWNSAADSSEAYENETYGIIAGIEKQTGEIVNGRCYFVYKAGGIGLFAMSFPEEQLENGSSIINILLYYLSVLALCTILCVFLTKFIYLPLNRFLDNFFHDDAMFYRRSFDEYSAIKQKIMLLVSQEEALRERLDSQKIILMDSVLESLISGNRREDDMEGLTKCLSLEAVYPKYQILLVEAHNALNLEVMDKIIKSVVLDDFYTYPVAMGSLIVILLNGERKEQFDQYSERLWQKIVEGNQNHNKYFGAGEIVNSAKDLKSSYDCAFENAQYYYFPNRPEGFNSVGSDSGRSDEFQCAGESIKELLRNLGNGENTRAVDSFRAIVSGNDPENRLTVSAGRRLVKHLYKSVNDYLESFGKQSLMCRAQLRNIHYEEDLLRIENLIDTSCRTIKNILLNDSKDYLKSMRKYVDENIYDSNLSLNSVSQEFGYSSTYISRIFKDNIKKNFLDYVISTRIVKSKELLECTDIPIKSIALKVGFNSDLTFRRIFKKEVGITPGNYRILHKK